MESFLGRTPQFERTLVRDFHSSVTWRIRQVTNSAGYEKPIAQGNDAALMLAMKGDG